MRDDDRKEKLATWAGAVMAGFLVMVFFAWAALQALLQPATVGAPGRVALNLAMLPSKVAEAWDEAKGIVTGQEATRFLSVPRPDVDMAGFRPVRGPEGTAFSELMVRGDAHGADRGWRLLGGAMQADGRAGNMAVLLDPDLRVARVWDLHEDDVEVSNKARESRRVVHGLQILPDASIVFGFDHGAGLQRRDACNRPVWVTPGTYHHSVMVQPDQETLWALRDWGFADEGEGANAPPGTGPVELDLATGAVRREISLAAIMAANPRLGLFELARKDENAVETNATETIGQWLGDPVHFNDVEPLPAEMADVFDGFAAGDLLISARDLNTVFVVDPETLKVKWHHTGGMLRQHDPDWRPDGTISVFDNAMGLGTSRIITIDPETHATQITYDGEENGFYTRIRGKHMRTARGDLAIVSPQQGRAFELGPTGAPVLEFINLKPGVADKSFVLTEYLWLPETALDLEDVTCTDS
ncbi:arylsulfotransferase family protein [Marimonas lutisalis]|uniref:arylsulfotransferase family protein n=1 Tax=Marimonas lutisalis TaxID=2545756 RepID=UPI0010F9718C|nr:arylsulfotransferase family protein [Marimonas lutisalis]